MGNIHGLAMIVVPVGDYCTSRRAHTFVFCVSRGIFGLPISMGDQISTDTLGKAGPI